MENEMNFKNMAIVLSELKKLDIETEFVSPNYVNDLANTLCIKLTSEEVVKISDDYIKT